MIEESAKILLGTALYVAVLWEATRNPRAAGMMLTFPALNGISLLVTDPGQLEQVAGTMLLVPVINALICVFYISVFNRMDRANFNPLSASRLLLISAAGIWSFLAGLISRYQWGVSAGRDVIYAAFILFGGLLFTAVFPARPPRSLLAQSTLPLRSLVIRNRKRIALFTSILVVVIAVNKLEFSPVVVGILAALPLIPFLGLYTITNDGSLSKTARQEELSSMANGVWLGPAIAVIFICTFWRWLTTLAMQTDGVSYLFLGTISLLICWGGCIVLIWLFGMLSNSRPFRRA